MDNNIEKLEKKIGYTFKNKDILLQSLRHSSFVYEYKNKGLSDNELLEFLGDSVLGFVIADFLYSNYPGLAEGDLSKLKATAASTDSLASFAKEIKLDKHIFLGKGEEKSGGRKKNTILAGAFEALTAALYLDGGLKNTKYFLLDFIDSFFNKITIQKHLINNYKSALQEYFQRSNLPSPVYNVVKENGPQHKKSFIVEVLMNNKSIAKAKGLSKKTAEQKAAQKALKKYLGNKIKNFTEDTFFLNR